MRAARAATTLAVLVGLAGLVGAPAHAAPLLGGRTALMGGAGVAQGRDESAFWLNPAGLTAIDPLTLNLSLSAYGVHTFHVDGHFGEALPRPDGAWNDDGASQSIDVFPGSMGFFVTLSGEPGRPYHQVIGAGFLTLSVERWDFHATYRQVGISDYVYDRKSKGDEHSYASGVGYAIELPHGFSLGASALVRWTVGSWDVSDSVDSYSATTRGHTGLSYNDIGDSLRVALATVVGARWQRPLLSLGLSVRLPEPVLHERVDGGDKTIVTQAVAGTQSGTRSSGSYSLARGLSDQYLEPSLGVALRLARRLVIEAAFTLALPLSRSSLRRIDYSATDIASGKPIATRSDTFESGADYPLAFTAALGADLSLGRWSLLLGVNIDRARVAFPADGSTAPAIGWALDQYAFSLGIGYGGKTLLTYLGVRYIYGSGSYAGVELDPQTGAAPAAARPMQDHRVLFTLSGSIRMPRLFSGKGS